MLLDCIRIARVDFYDFFQRSVLKLEPLGTRNASEKQKNSLPDLILSLFM